MEQGDQPEEQVKEGFWKKVWKGTKAAFWWTFRSLLIHLRYC